MKPTTEITFTPGKYYRTRDGRKAEYVRELKMTRGARALVIFKEADGTENVYTYLANGRFLLDGESTHDLIAEWVDKPEVDWSVMPAWAVAVAQNKSGDWNFYDQAPIIQDDELWLSENGDYGSIPPAYAPKFAGSWRDSLVTREGTK